MILDYEQKYKEALEKARQLCAYPTTKPFISDLQDMFPELKESEAEKDARISKRIIECLKGNMPDNEYRREYISWLEKQGEQKETLCDKCRKEHPSHFCQDITALGRCALEKQGDKSNKVEPKFKVGDFICK